MDIENGHWKELSVLQAAHAAEILIKARIAQEHPLLIFEQMPRYTQANSPRLELQHLFELGRTIQYFDLPERLWATTGIQLADIRLYQEFGKLRNKIQHFSTPQGIDTSIETRKFIFGVIDPFIHECWGLFAIDYNEDYERYLYFVPTIIANGIPFLVSSDAAKEFEKMNVEWPEGNADYKREMLHRIDVAKASTE